MDSTKKVEVCRYCSGFDVMELKDRVKAKVACIGKCSRECPELNGKVYGFLNGEFTVCDTKEAFFAKIDALDAYAPAGNKNPLVDAFLSRVEKWLNEFEALRMIALDNALTEELKWGQPCYTHQDRNVIILGGFKDYIALSFFKGALLTDPSGVLVRQTENVQAGRQLRFTSVPEIAEKEALIRAYLHEAIELETSGAKLPDEPKKEMAVPDELQIRFDAEPALKAAFYALTPGRQRGYLFHFTQPKQSKTRAARIDKYAQKILDGKGLED